MSVVLSTLLRKTACSVTDIGLSNFGRDPAVILAATK